MYVLLKFVLLSSTALALLFLSSCSQPAPKTVSAEADTKTEAAPVVPVTAKDALWPMYTSARNWTTDFVILKLTPKELSGFKNDNGKAGMWEATFASPNRHEYRVFTYSIAAQAPDIQKGVVVGRALPWNGATREAMPIQLSDFNVDSDKAYQIATAEAAVWLKKNPDKKLSNFELWNSYRFQSPTWYLMWGDKKAGYVAFVSAATGKIMKGK
jgi:hypothetical protein